MSSQTGEIEMVLDEVFPDKQNGFFLEIGAWDGIHLSQTFYLEQKGWKGLCVEPFPHNFESRSCMLCTKALGAVGGERPFIWVTTDRRDGGDVSYLSGFKDNIKMHWDFIRENCNYSEVNVDTITWKNLYRKYHLPSYIDFLSVDTEGAEVELFSALDLDIYRFGLISFEHNLDMNVKRFIGERLQQHGYKFYKSIGLANEQGGIEDLYISEGL